MDDVEKEAEIRRLEALIALESKMGAGFVAWANWYKNLPPVDR